MGEKQNCKSLRDEHKRLTKKLKEGTSGITLVALVVTIVVLIILATITINIALNGGIADKAQKAKMLYENEEEKEQEIFQNVIERMNEIEAKVPMKNVTDGDEPDEDVSDDNVTGEEEATEIIFTILGVEYRCEKGTTWREFLSTYESNPELDAALKKIDSSVSECTWPIDGGVWISKGIILMCGSDYYDVVRTDDEIVAYDYWAKRFNEPIG